MLLRPGIEPVAQVLGQLVLSARRPQLPVARQLLTGTPCRLRFTKTVSLTTRYLGDKINLHRPEGRRDTKSLPLRFRGLAAILLALSCAYCRWTIAKDYSYSASAGGLQLRHKKDLRVHPPALAGV